jgi:hypothetical protein
VPSLKYDILSYIPEVDNEEFMPASPLPEIANQTAIIGALPSMAEESRTTIVQFVRSLAIRHARLDAAQAFKAANDNNRGTLH